jgi:hypothetical protein
MVFKFSIYEYCKTLKAMFGHFRSTAELEAFNNLILMYAGKRFSYTPPVYRARCLLAAIDNNHHLQRPTLLNKQGLERYIKLQ